MEGESKDPKMHFDIGRSAARSGDFEMALSKFQYFFEHALDEDPGALYGVRLSFCLAEWARLGEEYPPAIDALIQKKNDSLVDFKNTRDPESFHDFVAICEYLKSNGEVVEQFRRIDESDSELSAKAYRFARDHLITQRCWSVCSAHTEDADKTYEMYIRKFDEVMEISRTDADIGGPEFDSTMRNLFIKDVSSLLLLLQQSGRKEEFDAIRLKLVEDMKSRDQSDIPDLILGRVAI